MEHLRFCGDDPHQVDLGLERVNLIRAQKEIFLADLADDAPSSVSGGVRGSRSPTNSNGVARTNLAMTSAGGNLIQSLIQIRP